MSQAYTPGLLVTSRTWWRCRRVLPIPGKVLVQQGEQVQAQDVVAETEMPGDVTPVNVARQMGLSAAQVPGAMVVTVGDAVEAGQVLAKTKGMFGLFGSEFKSPVTGTVEAISAVTGQVMLRGAPLKVQVRAYLSGKVTEVFPNEGVQVESAAAVIQGIFGIGGEAFGPVCVVCNKPDEDLTEAQLTADLKGCVVIGGRRITRQAVDRARTLGVAALIAGGIDDQDLREILGYDLGVAVTGSEQLGLSIIVTEGFGDIAMADRTFRLFQQLQGSPAAANGTTQIRAGVLRPEVIIPLESSQPDESASTSPSGVLQVGAPVRVIREPYFGDLGVVVEMPSEPQMLQSQSKARVVTVRLAHGATVSVPRANVELIEGALL